MLAGLGTGAESAIIAPFLAEFVPPARRGWFLGALAGFFSFGFVGAALIGRFVVPLSDAAGAGPRYHRPARADAAVVAPLPARVPSLPVLRGRTAEAEQVVADFERRSRSALGAELPPVPTSVAAPDADRAPSRQAGRACWPRVKFLWSRAMARRTAVTWLIWFVHHVLLLRVLLLDPDPADPSRADRHHQLLVLDHHLPGADPRILLRRLVSTRSSTGTGQIAIYLVGSAISAFWLSQRRPGVDHRRGGALLSFFLNGTYAGVYAYTPEVFPTWVRATGHGDVQRFRADRLHHRPERSSGSSRPQLGFAGVFAMTTAVLAGRGGGRARLRPRDGRSVAGGPERAAGAGRLRAHVARRAVTPHGMTSRRG